MALRRHTRAWGGRTWQKQPARSNPLRDKTAAVRQWGLRCPQKALFQKRGRSGCGLGKAACGVGSYPSVGMAAQRHEHLAGALSERAGCFRSIFIRRFRNAAALGFAKGAGCFLHSQQPFDRQPRENFAQQAFPQWCVGFFRAGGLCLRFVPLHAALRVEPDVVGA